MREFICRIAAMLPPSYHGVYANHPRLVKLLHSEAARSQSLPNSDRTAM